MTDPASPTPDQTLVYAHRDGIDLTLDLFFPNQAPPPGGFPGILFIHGGGWHKGSPPQFYWLAARAATQGFVAASLRYRLSGEAQWPAQLDDAQSAMRFMRQRAGEWQMNPEKLHAVGSSAGAHLVACLGVRDHVVEGVSSRASSVVAIHGVFDFIERIAVQPNNSSCKMLIGGTLDEKPEQWRDASPIYFIDEQTPPFLLTHDREDGTVPAGQSLSFADALVRHYRRVEFIPTPGSKHGFVYHETNPHAQRVGPLLLKWLETALD